jgi:uncharacterized phage infection (PIP) family protein YhgE
MWNVVLYLSAINVAAYILAYSVIFVKSSLDPLEGVSKLDNLVIISHF